MNTPISRRDFLKDSALGFVGMTALHISLPLKSKGQAGYMVDSVELGRVLKSSLSIHSSPRFSASILRKEPFNAILFTTNTLDGESDEAGNTTWYQLQEGGFIHSNGIQIVENASNPVVTDIPPNGILAQVTVPYTHAWKSRHNDIQKNQNFYYGSTHWVIGLVRDEQGNLFYKIKDDRWAYIYYVVPTHLHIFNDEELSPLSSADEKIVKRIEVNLQNQTIKAFEDNRLVFSSPMSSGLKDKERDYSTPPGEYRVIYKRPSRHMVHGGVSGDQNPDLFGVPWVSYFTKKGIAFHGTYWHNDYGIPRSNGCVNLPIPAARWIYLWSQPVVPPRAKMYASAQGTQVTVF